MKSKPITLRRVLSLVCICLCSASTLTQAATESLDKFPFWQAMAGTWESVNTYFDSNMNYEIRSYSSLVRATIDGDIYSETEHRFYPWGLGTERYGEGLLQPGEGVEVVTTISGRLIDNLGTVKVIEINGTPAPPAMQTSFQVFGNLDAMRISREPETGLQAYRYHISFTSKNSRLRSNIGLAKGNDDTSTSLRALVFYQDKRVSAESFQDKRQKLREKHIVQVISLPDPNAPGRSQVYRLPDPDQN